MGVAVGGVGAPRRAAAPGSRLQSQTRATRARWEDNRGATLTVSPLRPGETGPVSGFEGQGNEPQRSGTRPNSMRLDGAVHNHRPSTCASAASVSGSQNAMSMARYVSIAVDTAACSPPSRTTARCVSLPLEPCALLARGHQVPSYTACHGILPRSAVTRGHFMHTCPALGTCVFSPEGYSGVGGAGCRAARTAAGSFPGHSSEHTVRPGRTRERQGPSPVGVAPCAAHHAAPTQGVEP